jgi:hypothetical protein
MTPIKVYYRLLMFVLYDTMKVYYILLLFVLYDTNEGLLQIFISDIQQKQ